MTELERIAEDLGRAVDGLGVRGVRTFGAGNSGFTYAVDAARQLVLRLSPPGVRIAGPADVGRQGRIMAALHGAGLPVPRVLGWSSDPLVAGRAFVLMERVDGGGWEDAGDVAPAVIGVLHALAAVPLRDTGIGDEAPVDPEAELGRWSRLMARAPGFLHERAGRLEARLRERLPAAGPPTLVHGDLHLGNLLFADGAIAAVVDWEIAEIGQPLVDLGSLAVTALRHRYAPDPNPTGELGLPISELIARYGADEERALWYVALACFKYAAILGYNFKLHRSGRRPDPLYDRLLNTMNGLLDDGGAIADEGIAAADRLSNQGERLGAH